MLHSLDLDRVIREGDVDMIQASSIKLSAKCNKVHDMAAITEVVQGNGI